MTTRTAVAIGLILFLLLGCDGAQWGDPARQTIRLTPYTQCPLQGSLAAVAVERAPHLPMARPVETAAGQKLVSVADGYRLILAFPNTDPFVNLKIERSMDGYYGADKEAVMEQMPNMSANSRGVLVNLERSIKHGIDVAALDNPGLDGRTISFYTLFDDTAGVIVSAYILNQIPERRAFQDMTEYRALRDRFVEDFTSCMSGTRHN